MFHENQQISEFTLIKQLGRGGFGEVWLAENNDELFAVKLPHKDKVDWKAITQEIGLWTLCGKHPNVMPLIGARNFNGQIAIISEYAPDGSLEDLLRAKGKLSVEEAVEMTIGILEGLQHLHQSGIIHRDLKPANILLDGKTPRLTDFGISRIISADSLSETIAGTFAYMAPECFDGKRNVQTDIWSVGVILYRMLAGNLPFPQKEQTALVGSIIMQEPEPLADKVSSVVKGLVSKTLSKNPFERLSLSSIRFDLKNYIDDTREFLNRINHRKEILRTRAEAEQKSQLESINSAQLIPYRRGTKWGFCDAKKIILIEPKYDSARRFSENLALISDGEKDCFIDKFENKIELFPCPKQPSLVGENDSEIILPKYERIDDFSCGLARVRLDESWRFINSSGEELISLNSECEVHSFVGGLAFVEWQDRCGFINTAGQIPIPIIYESIFDCFDSVDSQRKFFCDDLVKVELNKKYGFINKTGEEIIPIIYESLSDFNEDLAVMQLNKKCGAIDKKGNEVIPAKYDSLFFQFNEGLGRAVLNQNCGFINKDGEEVIPLIYYYVWSFNEGLALVMLNEKLAFIDKTGKKAFSINYDGVKGFSGGLAKFESNEKYGYFDKTGKEVIYPKYDSAEDFKNDLAIVKLNGRYGIVNKEGIEIVKPFYHYIYPFKDGLAKVKMGYECGFINTKGEEIIPVKYSTAEIEGDLIKVSLNDWQTQYISKDGTEYFED